jgi:hypothetical protein
MKKIIMLSGAFILALGLFSCNEEVLDLNSTTQVSNQAIWSTEMAAEMYITASYKAITDMSQVVNSRGKYYDSYSDIMKSTSWELYNHAYNKTLLEGNINTGGAGPFECWSDTYSNRIRRANVLLDEISRYGVSNFGEDWCNIRRAEVRFCRAFTYYFLIRVYGGVVIRTDISGINGVDDGSNPEDIHRARATEAESWDFVISELQWAAEHLPESWPSEWEGRATKKAAYGLISRMAVFAKQWEVAVNAAEQAKLWGGELADDYAKVFQVDGGQDNSKEILFALYFLKNQVVHNYDRYNRPVGDEAVYGVDVYAEHVPTAELADLYEFKDGTAFNWTTYAANGHTDPYTDREPRFHATILYNGARWEGRTIQTYVGGTDEFRAFQKSSATDGYTCTGYYLRKYLQEGNIEFGMQQSYQYDAMLRYAEVLLNKAEAYAQWDYAQYRTQALAALNEVRWRVNLPPKTITDAPNLDAFMTLLRKERCVELAGEGFRYWDLRRWKLAEDVINGQMAHGVKITENAGAFTYERVDCDANTPRIFLPKFYYFSLPTSELTNNNLCENNPYW